MMVERHFAYFDGETGRCTREWQGPVPPPQIAPGLTSWARLLLLNAWATGVSQPEAGEVALDVTHLQYPVGDFCWAHFDAIDFRLTFPEAHWLLEVDTATRQCAQLLQTARPARSHGTRVLFDVTAVPAIVSQPLTIPDWSEALVGVVTRVPRIEGGR